MDLHDSDAEEPDGLAFYFHRCLDFPHHEYGENDEGKIGDDVRDADGVVESTLIDACSGS